ncbi:hypothetical protein NDU88_002326 [Pleurodeles waltl]|uniref:Uncharacterized protein n=1 Tax=Pleurodeles waltl TaxID=8319 RepID=A0AAV7W2Z5_PLEWA|nr:hypothetical protein NDU88_002326 [Pleurodeles waltl]
MLPRAVRPLSGSHRLLLPRLFCLWGRSRLAFPTVGGAVFSTPISGVFVGCLPVYRGPVLSLFCSLNAAASLLRVTAASLGAGLRGVLLVPYLSCPLLLPFSSVVALGAPPFQGSGWGFAHLGSSCSMRIKFLTIGFHWLLPCPGFSVLGPLSQLQGAPSRWVAPTSVALFCPPGPRPITCRGAGTSGSSGCSTLDHVLAAPAIGRAPRGRAVSAPHARSGLFPPALLVMSAAGGRHLLRSVKRGQPSRVPAYLSPRGESRQRSTRSEGAHSSRSACYARGRRASPPPLGQASTAVLRPSLWLVREAPGEAGLLAPDRLESGRSSLCGTAISSGVASLLRRRLRSGGAPLLRIIVRPGRSTRNSRPTSWLS